MTELEILTAVKNSGDPIDYVQLLNLGKTETNWDPSTDEALVKKLLKSKLLNGESKAYSIITLSDTGTLRLLDLQQQIENAKQQADNEAKHRRNEYRHDWAVAIVSCFVGAILGVIGTLLMQLIC